MSDFFIDGDDNNFIIESGSVPIFKVSGSTTYISGSLLPFEEGASSFSELGSEARPWKEIYVESASINFVDTEESVGASGRMTKFSKDDLDDVLAGKPPRGVPPLSRFSNTISMEARIGAVNKWYSRSRTGSNLLSLQIGTSDPDGTSIAAVYALKGAVYIAPQDLLINRVSCTMVNDRNNDNIIVTMFKGTVVNNSNAAVQIDKIGSTFAPTMTRNKTYVTTQTLTSGNQLSAGDFLLFTAHVTSYSSTSYPSIIATIDGQYR